ncbi:MAG: HIRAN domain-containing protein [Desulfobacteraceae bacterium]|nr:HIRAN domain-containing protein [Desulfobacteraceae bacterium]
MPPTRRDFIKCIGVLPLAAALARAAPAKPPAATPQRRLLLNRFSIAGFQYYNGPALARGLRPGDELDHIVEFEDGRRHQMTYKGVKGIDPRRFKIGASLKLTPEPRNPHDPFAVEIHLGRAKLGYVPRSDNKHISRLLEQGAGLECRVIEIDTQSEVWDRVRVKVWLA